MRHSTTQDRGSIKSEPADVAIPRLIKMHGGRVFNLGLRFCGNRAEAEDLVQETFLLAYRKWHQFEGRSDSTTWLYTIAARVCRKFHRRRSGEPRHTEPLSELLPSPNEAVPSFEAIGDDPFQVLARREAEEIVTEAISTLPPTIGFPWCS